MIIYGDKGSDSDNSKEKITVIRMINATCHYSSSDDNYNDNDRSNSKGDDDG